MRKIINLWRSSIYYIFVTVFLVVLFLPRLATTQTKNNSNIEWAKSIKDAKKSASAANSPIAVFLNQQDCRLSQKFMKNLMGDDRFPEIVREFVWLNVQVGTPEYKNWFVENCGGNVEGTPSLIFLNPSGDNADPAYTGLSAVTSPDADDIIPVLRDVMQRAKKPILDRDKTRTEEAVAKAKVATVPAEVIAAYKTVIRYGDGWKALEQTVQNANDEVVKILQKGFADIQKIQQSVRDPKDQLKEFEMIKSGYAGTCVADWATNEINRVKKEIK